MFHILWDLVPALSIVNERFQGAGSFCCHYVGWLERWLSLNNDVKDGASEQEEVERSVEIVLCSPRRKCCGVDGSQTYQESNGPFDLRSSNTREYSEIESQVTKSSVRHILSTYVGTRVRYVRTT